MQICSRDLPIRVLFCLSDCSFLPNSLAICNGASGYVARCMGFQKSLLPCTLAESSLSIMEGLIFYLTFSCLEVCLPVLSGHVYDNFNNFFGIKQALENI